MNGQNAKTARGAHEASRRTGTYAAAVAAAVALAAAVSLGACSPAHRTTAHPTAPSPSALEGCVTDATGQLLKASGGSITIGLVGSGASVVVLSNQSDENLCSWMPFANKLTEAGYRVAVWDYAGAAPPGELSAVVTAVRNAGGTRIVLMGASKGAKASLVAGAQITPAVAGVVSLSAEAVLQPATTVVDSVARLPCPVLLITAEQDPYGSADAARAFLKAAPNQDKQLVAVPGTDHGTQLLNGASASTVVPASLTFLHRVLRG
jgi:pimeloyl-ACP methyl ester carboxylesterase